MGFRLFGVNVEVQLGFWIGTVVIYAGGTQELDARVLVWVAVVLVSVLVHEYGHALAIKRHGIEPAIALHWMGGTTSWRAPLPLRRRDHVFINLAGPFAGFLFATPFYVLTHFGGPVLDRMPELARVAVDFLCWVNIVWGAVNLIPVLPWDGGHVLEHALGPKRFRLAAAISLVLGTGIALFALLVLREPWITFIFAIGAVNSIVRLRGAARPTAAATPQSGTSVDRSPEALPPLTPATAEIVRRAKQALADDDVAEARTLAEQLLAAADEPRAEHAGLEVLAWSFLALRDHEHAALALVRASQLAEPDRALAGAVLLATGRLPEARRVLEAARAEGDDRKEVIGPLVQTLIQQNEVSRAAAVALDVVDQLSADDVRTMARIAAEAKAAGWSARLFEALFARDGAADDAYEAARAHALEGDREKSLDLLRKAVAAGFGDGARAWSDAALAPLRAEGVLGEIVPPPVRSEPPIG